MKYAIKTGLCVDPHKSVSFKGGVMIDLIKLYNRHHQTLHFDTSMNDLDLNSRSCGYGRLELVQSLLYNVL